MLRYTHTVSLVLLENEYGKYRNIIRANLWELKIPIIL